MENNIDIIPYTKVDGIRTFKDSYVRSLYDRVISEGYAYIFNDGSIKTSEEFLHSMRYNSELFLMYWDNELVAICWLNRFESRSARLHWCGLGDVNPRKFVIIGKEMLKKLEAHLDLIIGYTPSSNEQAIKYAKLCGMTVATEIPNLCYNANTGKSESGVITYYSRSENEDL